MLIENIMSRSVLTAQRDATITDICKLMKENHMGSVVILNNKKPTGIITERDIVNSVSSIGITLINLKASDIMKEPLITLSPKDEVKSAASLMREKHIRRIPIIHNKILVGIVTAGDVLRSIQKELFDSHIKSARLEKEIARDGLTGLYTHKYFNIILKKEVERVKKYDGYLSLVLVDIDHFKQVNDIYGHSAGSKILKDIAKIITKNTSSINIISRYGGDEFAIIAPISGIERANQMGERFRRIIENTKFYYNKKRINITISVGISFWKKNMKSSIQLIDSADKALYVSKRNGRNKVTHI